MRRDSSLGAEEPDLQTEWWATLDALTEHSEAQLASDSKSNERLKQSTTDQ
jgi:hypothetical protein